MNYNAVDPFDVPEEKSSNGPLIVVVVLLLVLVGLLGVWLYATFRGSDQPEVTAAPTTVTSTKASHTPLKDVPTTVTLTTTASPTKESSTSSAPESTKPTSGGRDLVPEIPSSATNCGNLRHLGVTYWAGTEFTSCEFATEVTKGLVAKLGDDPDSPQVGVVVPARSPVTGERYVMRCKGEKQKWVCTGGNDAAVYVRAMR